MLLRRCLQKLTRPRYFLLFWNMDQSSNGPVPDSVILSNTKDRENKIFGYIPAIWETQWQLTQWSKYSSKGVEERTTPLEKNYLKKCVVGNAPCNSASTTFSVSWLLHFPNYSSLPGIEWPLVNILSAPKAPFCVGLWVNRYCTL